MKIHIEKIAVMQRIRKEVGNIADLAQDINRNGLINPITVMTLEDGQYQLLAGLRRLLAVQTLGWTEVEVTAVSPKDAEERLHIEISENEMREPFTVTEKVDFGRLLEKIEAAKAKERMLAGKKLADPVVPGPQGSLSGKSREAIGAKIGMSGKQYDRAKYIADNAPQDIIDQLDRGERTIRGTYDELRAKEKAAIPSTPDVSIRTETITEPKPQTEIQIKTKVESDVQKPVTRSSHKKTDPFLEKLRAEEAESIRKHQEFDALTPEGKIEELRRQLKEERARATSAESKLARVTELRQNEMYHYNATIDMLKNQLKIADARITELEEKYEPDKHTS